MTGRPSSFTQEIADENMARAMARADLYLENMAAAIAHRIEEERRIEAFLADPLWPEIWVKVIDPEVFGHDSRAVMIQYIPDEDEANGADS